MTTMFSCLWLVEAVGGDYSSVCDLTLYDSTKILTETGTNILDLTKTEAGTGTNFKILISTSTGTCDDTCTSTHANTGTTTKFIKN